VKPMNSGGTASEKHKKSKSLSEGKNSSVEPAPEEEKSTHIALFTPAFDELLQNKMIQEDDTFGVTFLKKDSIT